MTDAQFDAILGDIAAHGNASEALREHRVARKVFYAKLARDAEAGNRYARAKELGCTAVADEMLRIADESRIGEIVTDSPRGREVKTADMVERARLQVETRKWLLARLMPSKYGDRTVLASDPDNPIPPLVVIGGPRGDGSSSG